MICFVFVFQFRSQLSHVVRKYFTKSQEKKLQKGLDVNPGSGPGLGPCPKSQSFYSGVNLVTTAVNNQLVNGKAQTLALEKNLRVSSKPVPLNCVVVVKRKFTTKIPVKDQRASHGWRSSPRNQTLEVGMDGKFVLVTAL